MQRNKLIRSGFTLIELLVVIAILVILSGILLSALSLAKEKARRIQCMNNLRQCGLALLIYGDEHQRYPSQRNPGTGEPLGLLETVWTPINYGVAREWEEVIRGVLPQYNGQANATKDTRLAVFACPALGIPGVTADQPRGTDPYVFHMNYFYLGGAGKWTKANPSFSPIRPTDPPDWALMSDMVIENPHPTGEFPKEYTAHRNPGGTPAGANHLFHDGHVEWVRWNDGKGLRANANWAANEFYYWRRTVGEP